jgi:hypothetical protein
MVHRLGWGAVNRGSGWFGCLVGWLAGWHGTRNGNKGWEGKHRGIVVCEGWLACFSIIVNFFLLFLFLIFLEPIAPFVFLFAFFLRTYCYLNRF